MAEKSPPSESSGGTYPRSKVARLIEKYGLEEVGDELERRWTRSENRSSLRELADYFNQKLLRSVVENGGADPLQGEVENLYELLSDDSVTSGVRHQARHRIRQHGADVESLEDDFVSYQSIRTYLKNYRNATLPSTSQSVQDRIDKKRDTIRRLSTRLSTVAEQAMEALSDTEDFTLGDFDIIVSVRLHCSDCNTQRPVSKIFANRGCDCRHHTE